MLRAAKGFIGLPALVAVFGCAGTTAPPAESPTERDVSLEEVVEAQRSASELALVAELLTRPEPTYRTPAPSKYAGPVACEKVSRGALHQELGLRFGPGEMPFGVFDSGSIRVVVPASSDRLRALHVTSDNEGLVVHAVVDPGELALYPTAPTRLGGFVIIGGKAPITLEGASLHGLFVRYELAPSGAVTTTLDSVRGSVTCEDLELAPGDAVASDGLLEPMTDSRTLERSKSVPLALVPGGRAVTHLRVEEQVRVDVLEDAGRAAKIAIRRSDDLLFGWVPSSALGPASPCCEGHIGVLGHGAGTGTGLGFNDLEKATCPFDVPFDVERAGRRRRAGFVREGTRMCLDDLGSDDVEIHVHARGVTFAPDARLLVPRALIDRCQLRLEPKLNAERTRR